MHRVAAGNYQSGVMETSALAPGSAGDAARKNRPESSIWPRLRARISCEKPALRAQGSLKTSFPEPSPLRQIQRLILGALIFSGVSLGMLWLFAFIFADASIDTHYMKLASPKSNRLVLGTSRASQGIDPRILGPGAINFAFTMSSSPFGETYEEAIRKKVGGEVSGGNFIVEVSPLAVSDLTLNTTGPREEKGILSRTWFVSGEPNLQYLIACYGKPLWTLAVPRRTSILKLREDGMLVVTLDESEEERSRRIRLKTERYADVFAGASVSNKRIESFRSTLRFLAARGDVTVVRLPMGRRMYEMEKEYWPGFSSWVEEEADAVGARFVDLSTDSRDSITTDGNHLTTEAAAAASEVIRTTLAGNSPPSSVAIGFSTD